MNSHLWGVHAHYSPQLVDRWTCVSSPLLSHTPLQDKNRWSNRSCLTLRLSTWSRWRLPVSFLAPRIDFSSCYIHLLFLRLPLCNKVLWLYCDIYLYALCYYICCLLWRMYEMHPALFLKARVWQLFDLQIHKYRKHMICSVLLLWYLHLGPKVHKIYN
jgi:hypothetical protein